MEKQIVAETMRVGDLKTNFGNPRKINKNKKEDLKASLTTLGDFGLIVINEEDQVLCGNQRVAILKEMDENTEVLCKRLIGYTEAEQRAVNIKDNTHAGEWDLDLLSDWMSDITIDLGLDIDNDLDKKKVEGMEPIRFEKYDYVIIACDNEIDYNELIRNLGLEGQKVKIAKRKIKARAVWYKDIKAQIVPKEGV